MLVVNNQKNSARIYLRNDIASNVTALNRETAEIEKLVNAIRNAVGGARAQTGDHPEELCNAAMEKVKKAVWYLNKCRTALDQVEVREEVNDQQY